MNVILIYNKKTEKSKCVQIEHICKRGHFMKTKNLIFSVLLMFVLLTGCSSGNSSKARTSNIDTFDISYNDFFDNVQSSVQKEYPSLFMEEPEVSTLTATETTPETIVYTHSIFNSAQLVVYEEKSNGEVYQVLLSYEPFSETSEDAYALGYVSGVLFANIEISMTVAERIAEELNLTNVVQTATTSSTGTTADWLYVVNANEDNLTSTVTLTAIAS